MPTNKSEAETGAEEFLCEARDLITNAQVVLVPREENVRWIEELEITVEQAWEVVGRLTLNNYCSGPEEDWGRGGTFLWIFGGTIEKQETYIKLKIEDYAHGKILECLSFHKVQFALHIRFDPEKENYAIPTILLLRNV